MLTQLCKVIERSRDCRRVFETPVCISSYSNFLSHPLPFASIAQLELKP